MLGFLLLVGNPGPPLAEFREIVTAPDSVEFVELTLSLLKGYTIDLSDCFIVTPGCTTHFKEGATVEGDVPFVLDTSLLEAPISLPDSTGFIRMVGPEGIYGWLDYSPNERACGSRTRTPPPGQSSSSRGMGWRWWYYDATPTPGAGNDDMDADTNIIWGHVYDGETGQPIGGAQVDFGIDLGCFYPNYDTVHTESQPDGSYSVGAGVAPSYARVYVRHDGYGDWFMDSLDIPYNFVHLEQDIYLYSLGATEASSSPAPFLRLYPNPTPGLLKLSWLKGPQDVFIYDVLGREVKALPGELGYAEVNLPPGVYFVKRGEQRIRAIVKGPVYQGGE